MIEISKMEEFVAGQFIKQYQKQKGSVTNDNHSQMSLISRRTNQFLMGLDFQRK